MNLRKFLRTTLVISLLSASVCEAEEMDFSKKNDIVTLSASQWQGVLKEHPNDGGIKFLNILYKSKPEALGVFQLQPKIVYYNTKDNATVLALVFFKDLRDNNDEEPKLRYHLVGIPYLLKSLGTGEMGDKSGSSIAKAIQVERIFEFFQTSPNDAKLLSDLLYGVK